MNSVHGSRTSSSIVLYRSRPLLLVLYRSGPLVLVLYRSGRYTWTQCMVAGCLFLEVDL